MLFKNQKRKYEIQFDWLCFWNKTLPFTGMARFDNIQILLANEQIWLLWAFFVHIMVRKISNNIIDNIHVFAFSVMGRIISWKRRCVVKVHVTLFNVVFNLYLLHCYLPSSCRSRGSINCNVYNVLEHK